MIIGLVAEGAHDFIMLEPFIRAELGAVTDEPLQFVKLQPSQDATSGNVARGGWSRVVAWCQTHSGNNLDTFFFPLFAGQQGCDIIVVQIDGDAATEIVPHTTVALPPEPITIAAKVSFLTKALEGWLLQPPERRSKIAIAVPVEHTEAWVIGAEASHPTPAIIDAKSEFRRSFNRRIIKLEEFYRRRVADLGDPLPRPTCPSYAAFRNEITALNI